MISSDWYNSEMPEQKKGVPLQKFFISNILNNETTITNADDGMLCYWNPCHHCD